MVTVIRTEITGGGVVGGGLCSLSFFDVENDVERQGQIDAVGSFWEGLSVELDESVTFQVSGEVSRYAASTGELQEVYALDGAGPYTGNSVGNMVPKASQALVRWGTDDIVAGRRVRGRTFIPGVSAADLTDAGQISAGLATAFEGLAEALITGSANTLVIWHRPVNGAGGSEHAVTTASVARELAVLRSRRD